VNENRTYKNRNVATSDPLQCQVSINANRHIQTSKVVRLIEGQHTAGLFIDHKGPTKDRKGALKVKVPLPLMLLCGPLRYLVIPHRLVYWAHWLLAHRLDFPVQSTVDASAGDAWLKAMEYIGLRPCAAASRRFAQTPY